MERAPGARDARVFAGRLHGEDGDAAADVHAEVRVRLREVEAPLLAFDNVARLLPVVALVQRPVFVDEVDAVEQRGDLVELVHRHLEPLAQIALELVRAAARRPDRLRHVLQVLLAREIDELGHVVRRKADEV